jgi:hypothetical protein
MVMFFPTIVLRNLNQVEGQQHSHQISMGSAVFGSNQNE